VIWFRVLMFTVAVFLVILNGENGRYGLMAAWMLIGLLWGALLFRSMRE